MRVLVFQSDGFAPFVKRIAQPFAELKRYDVEMDSTPILPSFASRPGPDFQALVDQISRYDVVICQRIIELAFITDIKSACFLLNKPLVFEVDDDYLHLETHNPCYFSPTLGSPLLDQARELQMSGRLEELQALLPQLNEIRLTGLAGYKQALGMFDAITCTTEELAQSLCVHNKNVHVFPNQMERVFYERDYELEQCNELGKLQRTSRFGMESIPAFVCERDPENKYQPIIKNDQMTVRRIARIGYSGTLSHRQDFLTIAEGWNRVVEKYANQVHFVYMGDPWFFRQQKHWTGVHHPAHTPACPPDCDLNIEGDNRTGRRQYIPETGMDTYMLNLRNLDIGIAPLEPTVFNMAKSDLKALEYAAWGICPVLPAYVTYARSFEHGKTAMLYKNDSEFEKCLDYLIRNPGVAEKIGRNARDYVANFRLWKHHAERHRDFLVGLIASKKPFVMLNPNKVKKNAA